MADVAPSKPRVLLSILKCACFEHLEGETLFTAISAGYGRFECERLLKPSGVELMNLPASANIEVSVLRKDRDRQKQCLYHGLVPLSTIHPAFATDADDPKSKTGNDGSNIWESWVGLLSADVNLKSQAPDRLFQRCLEMGASNARFPRLLLRLQYLPPGVSAVQRPVSTPSEKTVGEGTPGKLQSQHLGAAGSSTSLLIAANTSDLSRIEKDKDAAGGSPLTPFAARGGQTPQAQADMESSFVGRMSPEGDPVEELKARLPFPGSALDLSKTAVTPTGKDPVDELKARLRDLERDNLRLQERNHARDVVDREFFQQVCPLLEKLGQPSHQSGKSTSEIQGSAEVARAQLAEIAAALAKACEAPSVPSAAMPIGTESAGGNGRCSFYKPDKTDPVDCLLAANLLRLDAELPRDAEFARLEHGVYSVGGETGSRVRCHIDGGRLLVRFLAGNGGDNQLGSVDLAAFVLGMPAGQK